MLACFPAGRGDTANQGRFVLKMPRSGINCQRHDIWPLFTIFNVRYLSTRLTAFLQRYLVVFWRQILAQHASFSFLS
ncbi:TPA: hypothetical protein MHT98_09125 [Klebsiella pneumoniae]|nr:hypothetical protein C6648_19695 [Salmonella enterica]EFB2260364.1 hypothetical protein [Escherichia coli]ESM90714.1 hypothetical protein L382_02547 [Klebsiella pneumoniae MGH 36]OUR56024.1 hypothetical protein AZZ70_000792 [Klebsiella pneumoniae]HBY0476467.1 hypothetical protein [Klebsiella pneumoniae subsp. pneumoniae]